MKEVGEKAWAEKFIPKQTPWLAVTAVAGEHHRGFLGARFGFLWKRKRTYREHVGRWRFNKFHSKKTHWEHMSSAPRKSLMIVAILLNRPFRKMKWMGWKVLWILPGSYEPEKPKKFILQGLFVWSFKIWFSLLTSNSYRWGEEAKMAEAFKVRPHVRRVVNVVQSDRRHQVTLHDMRSWKVGESLYNCFFLFFCRVCVLFLSLFKLFQKKMNPSNSICKVPL